MSDVLFVSRKFPPSVGGMETLAKDVAAGLEPVSNLSVLALGRSNRHLLWWVPLAVVRTLWTAGVRRRVDAVLLGDAVMNLALGPLLRLLRVRYATMIMGLDVTWRAPGYRTLIRLPLRMAPRVLAISSATASAAVAAGARAERTSVVRLAVEEPAAQPSTAAASGMLRDWLGLPSGAVALVTLGRVVRRKGALWFTRNVLPTLPDRVHYVVAGSGPDVEELHALARTEPRLHVVGPVDDGQREVLLRGADVFVQPNIPVSGDMEGFGLVTLEATVRGTPVAAADIEGIRDVIHDGRTGWVVPAADVAAWRERITEIATDPGAAREVGAAFAAAARAEFTVERMGRDILQLVATTAPRTGAPMRHRGASHDGPVTDGVRDRDGMPDRDGVPSGRGMAAAAIRVPDAARQGDEVPVGPVARG